MLTQLHSVGKLKAVASCNISAPGCTNLSALKEEIWQCYNDKPWIYDGLYHATACEQETLPTFHALSEGRHFYGLVRELAAMNGQILNASFLLNKEQGLGSRAAGLPPLNSVTGIETSKFPRCEVQKRRIPNK